MALLTGKVTIVTGGANGIGRASALRFAREGAAVAVADIDSTRAAAVADEITAAGGTASAVDLDLGDVASVRAAVERTVTLFDGLDVLLNNAAATNISRQRDHLVTDIEPAVWDETMAINVRGTAVATAAAIPHMLARGGGAIINVSSGAALAGDLRVTAYSASKAAVISLTRSTATQYGKRGIRCNAITPGLVLTDATALSGDARHMRELMLSHHLTPRLGRPADIASAAAFLASDEAAFITGHVLAVDGGLLAHMPFVSQPEVDRG